MFEQQIEAAQQAEATAVAHLATAEESLRHITQNFAHYKRESDIAALADRIVSHAAHTATMNKAAMKFEKNAAQLRTTSETEQALVLKAQREELDMQIQHADQAKKVAEEEMSKRTTQSAIEARLQTAQFEQAIAKERIKVETAETESQRLQEVLTEVTASTSKLKAQANARESAATVQAQVFAQELDECHSRYSAQIQEMQAVQTALQESLSLQISQAKVNQDELVEQHKQALATAAAAERLEGQRALSNWQILTK